MTVNYCETHDFHTYRGTTCAICLTSIWDALAAAEARATSANARNLTLQAQLANAIRERDEARRLRKD